MHLNEIQSQNIKGNFNENIKYRSGINQDLKDSSSSYILFSLILGIYLRALSIIVIALPLMIPRRQIPMSFCQPR